MYAANTLPPCSLHMVAVSYADQVCFALASAACMWRRSPLAALKALGDSGATLKHTPAQLQRAPYNHTLSTSHSSICPHSAPTTPRSATPSTASATPCHTCSRTRASEREHAAQALAVLHVLEGLVDVVKLHLMCDVLVQHGVARLVFLHEAGDVPAALVATKGGALPRAARDEVERPRLHVRDCMKVLRSV